MGWGRGIGGVAYLLSLLDGYEAGELRNNGILLADVDDERFAIAFHNLKKKYA